MKKSLGYAIIDVGLSRIFSTRKRAREKTGDIGYIKEQNIGCLAVSQYADGWYLALPFVDVFDLYNPDDIKKNYLEIIQNAMFAKVSKGNYIAYWYNLIGNIPLLLYKYNRYTVEQNV